MTKLKEYLENIDKIVLYLREIETASLKETHEMFLGRLTVGDFQHTIQLGLDKGSFEINDRIQLTLPEDRSNGT